MARKLKPHEEQALLEATPFTELTFSAQGCHARHIRKAMDHPFFDKQPPTLAQVDLLLDEDLVLDDWF
jgi:hypothetical protein